MDLRNFIKPVEWQSHGKSRLPKPEMEKAVAGLIHSLYGITKEDLLPLVQMYEWTAFYRPDGAKITKSLQTIVRKFKTKEETAKSFPDLGRLAAELFEPSSVYKAEFVDKSLIGEGTLEGKRTCFSSDGANAHNRHFLELYRRIGVLKITDKTTNGVARCIVYFGGHRNVFLFNFYFRGVTQNRHLFIEAYRRIIKMKKVMYKDIEQGGFFLPIYRNTKHAPSSPIPAVHLYDEKSRFPKIVRKMPCPYCRKEVLETELWSDMKATEKYGACSKTCLMRATGRLFVCGECHNEVEREHSVEIIVNNPEWKPGSMTHPQYTSVRVCKKCSARIAKRCGRCERTFHNSAMSEDDDGRSVCNPCFSQIHKCQICGKKRSAHSYSTISTPEGARRACSECQEARIETIRCEVCRSSVSSSTPFFEVWGQRIRICPTCKEIYKGFRTGKAASL